MRGRSGREQYVRVGHSYSEPILKLLFATARTCAYPTCQTQLVFVDESRGVREIAVQIAHIRSEKSNGPRHDPSYPVDRLNSFENLLLLCGVHHHPVDRNESKYTIADLTEWKEAQLKSGGGFQLEDSELADLAATLEGSLAELVVATRLQLSVCLVGGRVDAYGRPARMELSGLGDTSLDGVFVPGRFIGIEVVNRGPVGAEVTAAGIDFDLGPDFEHPKQYGFPETRIAAWGFPCRVEGHSTCLWFEYESRLRLFVDHMFNRLGTGSKQCRPWAILGNGSRLEGDWITHTDLPIWEPGIDEAELRSRYGQLG